ncbi:MAG: glucosyltransferase domain-containing protein, partial [Ruminococcus sp.]|nr:glucosyltransferase domain-containing protein [Ruminococcus sp.]
IHSVPSLVKKISFVSPTIVIVLVGLIGCTIGFYAAFFFAKWLIEKLGPVFEIIKNYRIHFAVLSGVYIIGIIALVRANFYYVDDLGRTVDGYEMTGDFSRYIANIMSEVFHGNSWLADISPLPQILAVLIMAFTGVVLLSVICDNHIPKIWSIAALVPLGLSPYFLGCLSYKYDAPYMAVSVLASVLPFAYYKKNSIKYFLAVFAGIIIMCATYQASSGIFQMIVVFICFLMWNKKENLKTIGKFLLSSVVGYVGALGVFRLLLMTPLNEKEYVDSSISISSLFVNLKKYVELIINDFTSLWLVLIVFICISFVIYIIKTTKQNKAISGLISLVSIAVMFYFSFGVYLLFSKAITNPRALYGVGVFITILSIPLFNCNRIYLGKASTILLSWLFVVFAFIYGNTLSLQKEYTDFRIQQVANDLNSSNILDSEKGYKLQVKGSIGLAKAVKNTSDEYPLISKLVPIHFCDSSWGWGDYQFREYYGMKFSPYDNKEFNTNDLKTIKDTYNYNIMANDEVLQILLKQ